jgi:von Willebrand factor type A domain
MTRTRWQRIKNSLFLIAGPIPISILIHLGLLLFILTASQPRLARELINVELEAGGDAADKSDQSPELALPEVQVPEDPMPHIDPPPVVDTATTSSIASEYARTETLGGLGSIGGGGLGTRDTNYGRAIGSGFGGYIGELRRTGLEVVLVIDGTGSMQYVLDDVKAKMKRLVQVLHELVPTANIGIVVFGGRREPLFVQALTHSSATIAGFLDQLKAQNGGAWQEDMFRGIDAAVLKMNWQLNSHKVIVLIGDTPPFDEDYAAVLLLARKFNEEGGTFNTIDLTDYEHEQWEIANCASGECGRGYEEVYVRHVKSPPILPLPSFYLQTRRAYETIALAGGGSMGVLSAKVHVNQEILTLAFGEKWQREIAAFRAAAAR